MEKSGKPKNHVLRPLFWWLILVLVLYGIRTHQRLMEKTRLEFTVTMQGQPHYEAVTTFDGKPIISGQKIPLGNHTFAVSLLKGEPFSTNLFVWYGDHNLGTIDLKRTMGTLSVSADPPAPFIYIHGPEWSVTLTNSSGLTQTVPTDAYSVEADYPHWQKSDTTTVFANQTTSYPIAPHFGGLQLGCNQMDATYQLQTADGLQISSGLLPATIAELPVGYYKIVAVHHGHQRPETLAVKADTTTPEQIDFNYGAVVFETTPDGAAVVSDNGYNWGATPLTLNELQPGNWSFKLLRNGYQSVQVSLDVAANQTNLVTTNLVSENYLHAMSAARQFMAAADYDDALKSSFDALASRPDDAEATVIKNEATGNEYIQQAKDLGNSGQYVEADQKLALALQALPGNADANQLMADYKTHEPEQIERERVERLNRPKAVYDDAVGHYYDANLFEDHEINTSMPARDAAAAIANALVTVQPTYKIAVNKSPKPETYLIAASQDDTGILTTSGRRMCIIVCGQTTDTNTKILFKDLEYKAKHNVSMQGLLAFRDDESFVPIDKSSITNTDDKLLIQIQSGVSNLTVRIQGAIGQTPAPAVQPAAPQ
jgi:tetratricopeptide (TPR) repeat protein